MKKIILYLRVSDELQADKDSLVKQEEQALQYCKYKGYTVHKVIKEVASGRKNNREGFLELESEIERAEFDILVFYELSRLARTAYVIHKLINSLRIANISFESITEPHLNSDSPTSKLMLGFMSSIAEVESDMISKRVKTRMKHYASQGYWLFKAPLGYNLGSDKILIENSDAELIKEIFTQFINGKSLTKIQKDYNTSHGALKRILTNVAYIGKTKFGFERKDNLTGKTLRNLEGEVFQGKHKPIIDDETFSLVQIKLKDISNKVTRANDSEHLLSGILRHQGCDYKAYGKIQTKDKYMNRYYTCTSCYKSINAKIVEEVVIESAKEYIKNLNFLDRVSQKKKTTIDKDKKKSNLISKKDRIVNAYMDNNISRDEYLKKIKEIESELELLKEDVPTEESNTTTLKNRLIFMFEHFDEKTIFEKKAILHLLIEEIVYEKQEVTIIYKV